MKMRLAQYCLYAVLVVGLPSGVLGMIAPGGFDTEIFKQALENAFLSNPQVLKAFQERSLENNKKRMANNPGRKLQGNIVSEADFWKGVPSSFDVTTYPWPEQTAEFGVKKNNGIAFSGGGNRAFALTWGFLQQLHHQKLQSKVDYISSVSGGSWAHSIYQYYQSGPRNDSELLGDYIPPQELTRAVLGNMPSTRLGTGITVNDFTNSLTAALTNAVQLFASTGNLDRNSWIAGVKEAILTHFGLANETKLFTLNENTRKKILDDNPFLSESDIILPAQNKRPFMIILGAVTGNEKTLPTNALTFPIPRPYEFTGIYSGYPVLTENLVYRKNNLVDTDNSTFGGLQESFSVLSRPIEDEQISQSSETSVTMNFESSRSTRASIALATGISSFAPAFDFQIGNFASLPSVLVDLFVNSTEILVKLISGPLFSIPAAREIMNATETDRFVMGDGGYSQLTPVPSLIARGVKNIIMVLTSDTPLNTSNLVKPVDPTLTAMFNGISGNPILAAYGIFNFTDFPALLSQMQSNQDQGLGAYARMNITTTRNLLYGIPAGITIDLAIFYNSFSELWKSQLPQEVQDDLDLGEDGPYKNFPFLPTAERYTNEQANLLASLQSWIVLQHIDDVRDIVSKNQLINTTPNGEGNPPPPKSTFGAIIGGIVGGVLLAALVISLIVVRTTKPKKTEKYQEKGNLLPDSSGGPIVDMRHI